ncbi:MAG: protein phosphatase 2C domain-containing protein [Gemmatimonadetes bacterium]|nr:protein phosphatase 2C domain-containing protein [Gemmatimonadota bacterium]
MSAQPIDRTLACVVAATLTTRGRAAGAAAYVPHGGLQGVVIAEGLGSGSRARRAALLAVYEAVAWLRDRAEHFGPRSFLRLFAHVHGELRSFAREQAGGGASATLLVAVDTGEELAAAYAGDGAIWHMRGNLDDPSPNPGSAVNLLGAHGKLRDVVDAAREAPPVPTVVTVSKDARFGDILILCTGGIYSADPVRHGIHQALRDLFAAWDGVGELPLKPALEACLAGLRTRGIVEADATLGVLVTAEALRHHRRTRAGRDEAHEGRLSRRPRSVFGA